MPQFNRYTLFTAQAIGAAANANSAAVEVYGNDDIALWLKWTQSGGASGTVTTKFQGSRDGTNFFDLIVYYADPGGAAGTNRIVRLVNAFNDTTWATGQILSLHTFAVGSADFLMWQQAWRGLKYMRINTANAIVTSSITVDAEIWGVKR